MTRRILRSILLTAMLAILLTTGLMISTTFRVFEGHINSDLRTEARSIAAALPHVPQDQDYLNSLNTVHRVTLILPDGAVLHDSNADEAAMENHAQRPEIIDALQYGEGESQRYSDTLSQQTLYYALRTDEGAVIRIASTEYSLFGVYMNMLPLLLLVVGLVSLLALFIARYSAAQIVAPVNSLDLDHPMKNQVYDELTPLLTRMDKQNRQIGRQLHDLEKAHAEASAIIGSMREGLVLVDSRRSVLSINQSAAEVLGVPQTGVNGSDVMSLITEIPLKNALTTALSGGSDDVLLERSERYIRAFASPVRRMGQNKGAVLLLVDVTDSYTAEMSRREFTANVSHELKTPLTAISGYAEIIRDGVARAEDVNSFADRIHRETSRLIHVLNDIFELARLDEKRGIGEKEYADLADLAGEAAARLQTAAENRGVSVTLTGEGALLSCYRALLVEMAYNLIDNAIRYTMPNGHVTVITGTNKARPFMQVTDDGIGIAPEHHQRVFERFYRVDKSRSKASGGTGLGLAIVKHGAIIHGAEVLLESAPGQGTTITVNF